MSYYVILNYDVTDQEMYEQYLALAGKATAPYKPKVLVADHEPNDLDGKSRHTLGVIEFESKEVAMQWYNSPEYQVVVNLRLDSTEGWLRGAPAFVPPVS